MFEIVSTCKGGGYQYCRTEPPHPRRNANGLYPLHRVLVENRLGRLLDPDEHVHHVDHDKTNNAPANLAVVTRSEHGKIHAPDPDLVSETCACGKTFTLKRHVHRQRLRRATAPLACSRSCSSRRPGSHSYRGGCRCDECTTAHRNQQRMWRAKVRAFA